MRPYRFALSVALLVVLVVLGSVPLGPLPALFGLLNPATGIWVAGPSYAPGATSFVLSENGRHASVTVFREADGFIGIASNETWAVYFEQGYVEAEYRLAQMEFLRLTAEGNLSCVVGPQALQSDIFFRELGNYRLAQLEASNLSDYTYMAISEFVRGVNTYISTLSEAQEPLVFKLLGYRPHNWSVTDVLALQQLFLWENTAVQFDPLYFTFALEKMPQNVVEAFYPAYPEGVQHPIVPEALNPQIYAARGNMGNLTLYAPTYFYPLNVSPPDPEQYGVPANLTVGDGRALINVSALVLGLRDLGSNNWAVGAPLTSGQAMLANDPHLSTTVPSIWIGFQLVSPGQNVVGVVFPGFPGIVLGHNPYLAWGATNGQIQQTYFYAEKTDPLRPNQYYMDGAWHNFTVINETIRVRGTQPYRLTVLEAANGVVIQQRPVTIAMDWVGLRPSYEITFFLEVNRATSVKQFQSLAAQYFKVATQNWVAADSQGNIGLFTYGDFPIIGAGNPRGILPGTGEYNWVGFIPVEEQPSLYDPPTGFVFSANQITVSKGYPYYIGWNYESGFRADEIYSVLSSLNHAGLSDMVALQLDVHDYSTQVFLKPLLGALRGAGYSGSPEYRALAGWDGNMYPNSTAATIYYFWLQNYIRDVFDPWLRYYNITPSEGYGKVEYFLGGADYYHGPLVEDLENWTLSEPDAPWFSDPLTGTHRNATTVMVEAFNQTLRDLTQRLGPFSDSWAWGNLHRRVLTSFFGISALDTESVAAAGDANTVNAAYGLLSSEGPSWRMVVDMSDPAGALGIYPGGLSEEPASPYYSNTFVAWNSGTYFRLIPANAPSEFYYLYRQGAAP